MLKRDHPGQTKNNGSRHASQLLENRFSGRQGAAGDSKLPGLAVKPGLRTLGGSREHGMGALGLEFKRPNLLAS